jgi:TorA maturation chaperone TorD
MQAAIASPVLMSRPLPAEEAARADFYALLSRLFLGAPDAKLLQTLAIAPSIEADGADPALAKAWAELARASAAFDADAAQEEYEKLFVGVGKAPVSIYSASYRPGATAMDHPRVLLRADLAALGLAPREGVSEPEDHFAALFETMRVLVAGVGGSEPAPVEEQKRFFERHVKSGAANFLAATRLAQDANYYRKVAAVGEAFLAIEEESFSLG